MLVGVAMRPRRAEIEDHDEPVPSQHAIRLGRHAEQVVTIAQVEKKSEDDKVEPGGRERETLRGAANQRDVRELPGTFGHRGE